MNEKKETPPPIRGMIVEDQGMMRAFFERWLSVSPQFLLVGSARSGEEALTQIQAARPDVLLVDYQLPGMDGLEFVATARQIRPQLRALVVSSLSDPLTLTRIRESGVEGYLEKDASPELLTEALVSIAGGQAYYSAAFRKTLSREGEHPESVGKILSRREQQVLALVLGRKTNREIADHLGLSARTVEFHRGNLMAKLEVKNFSELVNTALNRGWSPPSFHSLL